MPGTPESHPAYREGLENKTPEELGKVEKKEDWEKKVKDEEEFRKLKRFRKTYRSDLENTMFP